MPKILPFLLFLLLTPVVGQEFPLLTPTGLEDFKVGQRPPAQSSFAGLTTLRQELTEWEEGEAYRNVYLKLFQDGHYLGKARLNKQGVIDEIVIVDPRARYEGGFAVGSTWRDVQRVFPQVGLAHSYLVGAVIASSPQVPGLQAYLEDKYPPEGGRPAAEWAELDESAIPPDARVQSLRLFYTGE